MLRLSFSLFAVLSVLETLGKALNPIEVQSQDFVDPVTGNRFEVVGVDYQPGGESGFDPASGQDPLSDANKCLRDAALMQSVGFNTIRTYNVDPDINHDECASIFNEVGIYMLIDVNSPLPGQSINQADPQSSYTTAYLKRTFKVIDAFRGYPNLLGFFSANELINDWTTASVDPPYIRAVTRDLKKYIAARGGRSIPVGYSAADFRPALVDTLNYLQCSIRGESDSRSDFLGLNSYSWCGPTATFRSSTYAQLARDFEASTMAAFFSEYGCIIPSPRVFHEVPVLYGPRMTMWSGGLVYQWTNEIAGYGLVQIENDGSVQILIDLDNLEAEYRTLNFHLIQSHNFTARSLKPPTCEAGLIRDGQFSKDFNLPDAPAGTQELIDNGAGGQSGSLVPVTKTEVQVVVTQVDGSTSRGLTITPVSSANRPHPKSTANGVTSRRSSLTSSTTSSTTSITTSSTTSITTSSVTTERKSSAVHTGISDTASAKVAAPGMIGSSSISFGFFLAYYIFWLRA